MNNSKHSLQKVVSLHCRHIRQPYTLEEICEQVMGEEYNAELMLQHLLLWCATNERDNDGDGSVEQNLDTAHAALVAARKLAALSKMESYEKIGDAIKCVEGAFDMQPEADVRSRSIVCLSDDARQYALDVEREHRTPLASADRRDLEVLTMLLIQQRAVDGLNGRRRDAVAHRYFEDAVMSIVERVKSQNALAQPFADRQKVDAGRYDATNPKWMHMGICTVVGQRRTRCESGWMVNIMAKDGTSMELDSHWLSAANAKGD